jgi:hypothetical protein
MDYNYGGVLEILERCGPCATVQTEANGVSRSTYKSCHSLVGLWGLLCKCKRICLAWAALVGLLRTMYFFLTEHNLSPLPNKFARRSCRVACLSLVVPVLLPLSLLLTISGAWRRLCCPPPHGDQSQRRHRRRPLHRCRRCSCHHHYRCLPKLRN